MTLEQAGKVAIFCVEFFGPLVLVWFIAGSNMWNRLYTKLTAPAHRGIAKIEAEHQQHRQDLREQLANTQIRLAEVWYDAWRRDIGGPVPISWMRRNISSDFSLATTETEVVVTVRGTNVARHWPIEHFDLDK